MTEGDIRDVTVVIPVRNEEKNLERCLARLRRFTNVVVVDSQSVDQTASIAVAYGAKLLQFEWNGRYPKKRNWFLLNHRPQTSWVLFLDADEFLDEEFCGELLRVTSQQKYNGFWLNYSNFFLGRRLNYGVMQRKLALIKVGAGFYEEVSDSAWTPLDIEVHEHPILSGLIGEIKHPVEHRDFKGLLRFLKRHNDYAVWEANRYLSVQQWDVGSSVNLTLRQRFKYRHLGKWWYPWFYFFYAYIVRLGFLDGSAGFYYAFYKSWYFLSVRFLIRELMESSARAD